MTLLTEMKQISGIGYGFMAAKALFSALELELFTHLAAHPLSADELQRATRASPNALHTLLRACTSLGLIGRDGEHYSNSPAADQYLARGSRRYVGDYFRYQIDRQIYPALEQLNDALCGRPTTPLYARMASHDEAEMFSNAQHVGSLGAAHMLAQRIDAGQWKRLLDVAGGSGAFSIALCSRAPALKATILDFESVTAIAQRYVERAGLAGRIDTLAGDAVSTDWPEGMDAVLMSYLLSAMPADRFAELFDKAFRCLRPGGTLLVHDFMLEEHRDGPVNAALWFLVNTVGGTGQVSFCAGDLATVLRDCGFDVQPAQPLLPGLTGLLVATRPASFPHVTPATQETHMTAIRTLDTSDLETKVKAMYRAVAVAPEGEFHFEMGRALAERLGYGPAALDAVPAAAIRSFAGVGYYFDLAALKPGEDVVDLGSGSGMDSFLAARQVGANGRVTGIDMTDEQLEKATRLADEGRFGNVVFRRGYIDRTGLEAGCCDAVISNGVVNLAPDKAAVFSEAARILKRGGRLALADIVTDVPLPEGITCDATLWAACIGGAMQVDAYVQAIESAGLRVVQRRDNPAYRFLSSNATGASRKYGVKSISLLATKP